MLLVHGITVDMDEGAGIFVHLAERLTAAGFDVMRFTFRSHRNSGGTQQGVRIFRTNPGRNWRVHVGWVDDDAWADQA
ncbi:hypothetical protein AB0M45_33215 [Nocardia sp. NPDC051787]|uniref:hypothetical protein n=1 Tax=Nocardia sp. NPDC051787 TaxID=3155415 RepID=UPI00343DEF78